MQGVPLLTMRYHWALPSTHAFPTLWSKHLLLVAVMVTSGIAASTIQGHYLLSESLFPSNHFVLIIHKALVVTSKIRYSLKSSPTNETVHLFPY